MNIDKLSDQEIQVLFDEAFSSVASINNIGDYESVCKRTVGGSKIRMEIMIVGLAGSPTIDDFKHGDVENAGKITITVPDGKKINFKLIPSETAFLNSNDYLIVYESL